MENNDFTKSLEQLSMALALTDDPKLIEEFLGSILTPNEISEVSARWALVLQIYRGKSQRKISEDLGLSLCKITRGSKELKKENSPFKKMIEKWIETDKG
ncbi:MAG: Trp family transcriptional regulator [Spirochaetia bacterium]|jgi:TrpR family trp operon transcriptional repressor|nr:Trp family transcriptional regulator [Spirochaetia bacterium]